MMARQVRPWQVKPTSHRERQARQAVKVPASAFHQGQRRWPQPKARIYGCNLYLLAIIDWRLGKPGATIYASRGRRCCHGGDVGLAMPKGRDFDEDVVQGSHPRQPGGGALTPPVPRHALRIAVHQRCHGYPVHDDGNDHRGEGQRNDFPRQRLRQTMADGVHQIID